ncbi:MAG: hypothetical protein JXA01_01625 [Dehalococcoidia bacterium]|nr:hypothetical protein [Dehalococcoidia bacterium]
MSTVRRVFFYAMALVTLGILASGMWNLLSLALDTIKAGFTLAEVGDIKPRLSLGIAMVVIGGPLWFLFWHAMLRQAERDKNEAGSALRVFFLNIILIVFAFLVMVTLPVLLKWMLAGFPVEKFNHVSLATLMVSAIVWFYYWRISEKEEYTTPVAKTLRRWYAYGFSAAGLICLSVGLVQVLDAAFISLPIWQGKLVQSVFWNNATQNTIAWLLMGGLYWAFFWFNCVREDAGSSLRQVYFYLLTILGGALAGLIALTVTLHKVLYWAMGGDRDIVNYFQFLGWSVPAVIVAFCIWFYHLWLAQEESAAERQHQLSARRVHYYLMSFLGLGTLVAGLIILLGIPLDWAVKALNPAEVIEPDWWNNNLSLGISLLLVAIPIWWLYWQRITGSTEKEGLNERSARSRRIYLYVIIGASVVMIAADLVNIVYQLLNGILTGSLGLEALRNSRWSLQTVFIAIPLLIYHWQIARQDQQLGAEVSAARKSITVIIGDKRAPVIAVLEQRLGYKVRTVQYVGEPVGEAPELSENDVEMLVSQVNASAARDIMLVLLEGRLLVLPYK